VVAGTHGKTTTTALTAHLLHALGMDPSFLVGGVTKNFDASYRLGKGGAFVVEGDEYDSAFFEKIPKFWSYRPWGAIVTSLEHDHVDIYPDMERYRDAFRGFASRMAPRRRPRGPRPDAGGARGRRAGPVPRGPLRAHHRRYPDGFTPEWLAAPIAPPTGSSPSNSSSAARARGASSRR
jgi:UDP-N-acetylmuramate: L-alanyl-gamma-D-glutamyl-meso-diaminopimelate ligase